MSDALHDLFDRLDEVTPTPDALFKSELRDEITAIATSGPSIVQHDEGLEPTMIDILEPETEETSSATRRKMRGPRSAQSMTTRTSGPAISVTP